MIDVGLVGLGKMGVSHLAAFRAHPEVNLVGVCDASRYTRDVLSRYSGLGTFADLDAMLEAVHLDAVVVATPSRLHAPMVRTALDRGLHVFCEKPFTLDPAESGRLASLARERGLVTQVGYHNRFVAAFTEAKRLLDLGAIGRVSHALAEAYGPVVLKPTGSTWRTRKVEGGGCLYDYAAHPVDLLNWYLGAPESASGSVLGSVFSAETDDEVLSTLRFPGGASAQLSVSWSDDSQRKMTTQVSLRGTHGKIVVDRQEIRVHLRDGAPRVPGYRTGWNVRYTTELTTPVWYYLRGEEYSAQVDAFVDRVRVGATSGSADFAEAATTDHVLAMIQADAAGVPWMPAGTSAAVASPRESLGRRRLRALVQGRRLPAGWASRTMRRAS